MYKLNKKYLRKSNKYYSRVGKLVRSFEIEQRLVDLQDYYHKAVDMPLVLIELTDSDFKRWNSNMIIVNNAQVNYNDSSRRNSRKVTFTSLIKNKNIKSFTKKVVVPHSISYTCEVIHLNQMKSNCVFIVTSVTNVNLLHKEVVTIPSNFNKNDISTTPLSGFVILMIAKEDRCQDSRLIKFSNEMFEKVKECKHNIIPATTKDKHFGSCGNYFGFGNKGYYGMYNDISSVNVYSTKRSKNEKKQLSIDSSATYMENLTSYHVRVGVKTLSKVIPHISKLISPLLLSATKLQEMKGDINLKSVSTVKDGIYQSELCVNSITKTFHTECDCTYTMITVPTQKTSAEENKLGRSPTYFLFEINDKVILALHMKVNLSFMFHGHCLSHRQHCSDSYYQSNKQPFFNIGCYGNGRLFNHVKKSFERLSAYHLNKN